MGGGRGDGSGGREKPSLYDGESHDVSALYGLLAWRQGTRFEFSRNTFRFEEALWYSKTSIYDYIAKTSTKTLYAMI